MQEHSSNSLYEINTNFIPKADNNIANNYHNKLISMRINASKKFIK